MDRASPQDPESVRLQDGQDAFLPRPSSEFVVTPEIDRVTERALAYMDAGYPVHLTGVAGTGKTSLAFHLAAKLDQPAVLLHGDDEFARSDLVGEEVGYRKSRVVDNFIRSVLKTDEQVKKMWEENRLAKACREGYTLIYDEFTRSRAEANNVLLSILEERILNLPARSGAGDGYIRVHPDFRAIFTSNTDEYAGTHQTQSALLDRLITIELDHQDRDTEVQIAQSRSGIGRANAERIVDIVRAVRRSSEDVHGPSVRAAIALARVFADREDRVDPDDAFFREACVDVLRPHRPSRDDDGARAVIEAAIDEAVDRSVGGPSGGPIADSTADSTGGAVGE
jgi:gas vesicle protein GvpN